MLRILFFVFMLLLSVTTLAQEKPQGAELAYIPENRTFEKKEINVGDIVTSYAGFPITQEKSLTGVDHFLLQLEKQWEKEGKQKEFWKEKADWILKRTKGFLLQPIAFSEKGKPLYLIEIKQKHKEWNLKKITLPAGLFLQASQEKKLIEEEMVKCYQQGLKVYKEGRLKEALPLFESSLKLSTKINNAEIISATNNYIGKVYRTQGKFELSLQYLQKSLELCKKREALASISCCLYDIGLNYKMQKKIELALEFYQQSLIFAEQTKDIFSIMTTLAEIGEIYQLQGELDLALEHHQQCLTLAKQAKDNRLISVSLFNLGFIYEEQGKLQSALEFYQQALALAEETKNYEGVAFFLSNIGGIYATQGKPEQALQCLQRSVIMAKQVGELNYESLSLSKIGLIYKEQGKLEQALQCFQHNLTFAKQTEDIASIAVSLNNIGLVYEKQGKLESALAHYQKALALAEQMRKTAHIAIYLNNIGVIYLTQGKLEQALKCYQKSLKIASQLQNLIDITQILNHIGVIYYRQKKLELALKCYQQSLKIAKQIGYTAPMITSLNQIGSICHQEGKLELALKYYQQSLKIGKQLKSPFFIGASLNYIGNIYRLQGKQKLANKFRLEAIEQIKYIANKSGSGRNDFFKESLHEFAHTIEEVYFTQPIEAFKTLQYCKGFGFITTLSELNLSLEAHADSKLIQEKKILESQLSATYLQFETYKTQGNISKEALIKKKQQLQILEKKFENIIEEIRAGNPAYANIEYPKPVTIKQFKKILKEDEVLLEYFCAPKEHGFPGYTYCFIIGKEFFKIIQLEKTEKIEKEINYFRTILFETQDEEAEVDYYEQAVKLYQILLQPATKHLKGKKIKRFIIAPDGLLNLLAFDALCLPQKEKVQNYKNLQYLLDKYEISYTMSATIYYQFQKQTPKKQGPLKFLGIGDPLFQYSSEKQGYKTRISLSSLPGTQEELREISKLFGNNQSTLLLRKKAIEPKIFLEDLHQYHIIHFATHGLIDTKNPFYSSLALTQLSEKQQKTVKKSLIEKGFEPDSCSDGFLQVREIFMLHKRINAELIVLSACETALGKIESGDGIVGLTRAFQFAGTPSLVVSLWSVNDSSTNQFMQHFYKEMLKGNPSSLKGKRLNALYYAKKKLRHSREYSAPYYWAPFILRGLP